MSEDGRGSTVQRGGELCARVQFTGEDGRERGLWRKAENRTSARGIIRELLSEVESNGTAAFDNSKLTFADLCGYYRDNYLTEARYVNGIKVGTEHGRCLPLPTRSVSSRRDTICRSV